MKKFVSLLCLLVFGSITGYMLGAVIGNALLKEHVKTEEHELLCDSKLIDQETVYHVVISSPEMPTTYEVDLKMVSIETKEPLNTYCAGKEAVSFARKSPSKSAQFLVYNRANSGIVLFVTESSGQSTESFSLFVFGKIDENKNAFTAIGFTWKDVVAGLNDLFDNKIDKGMFIIRPTLIEERNLDGFLEEATSGHFTKFKKRNDVI